MENEPKFEHLSNIVGFSTDRDLIASQLLFEEVQSEARESVLAYNEALARGEKPPQIEYDRVELLNSIKRGAALEINSVILPREVRIN